jgi:hypothetical protein
MREERTARATNHCGKPEPMLRFRYEHSCPSHAIHRLCPKLQRPCGVEKSFCAFIWRNPLISLDSDERIQGNPTLKSEGFAEKRSGAKKTQINEPSLRRSAGDGAEPAPFKRKAALVVGASGLRRLHVVEGAGRRLLRRQTNGPQERPLDTGMKFRPVRRHDSVRGRDAHRRT